MARRRKSENVSAQDSPHDDAHDDASELPRVAQAIRQRRLGYTYEQIAQRCGYADESGARRAVKRASARIIRDEARALVGWQLDQIDMALSVVMQRIARDDKDSLWAVDRLTPLLKRQAELMGLDAEKNQSSGQPTRREYVGVNVEGV